MRHMLFMKYLAIIVAIVPVLLSCRDAAAQTNLIGRWITGPADYLDKSGFTPAGTHDGIQVGGGQSWTSDVPAGATGEALALNGTGALVIDNTKATNAGYDGTFDMGVASNITVMCWAKGWPGTWSPWVSKNGEPNGWQVRRLGGNNNATFTIRGTPGADDPGGAPNSNDGKWHHYAGVWDGAAGTRKLYVDGVPYINMTGDTAPMAMPTNSALMIGGRDNGGYGSYFNGSLFDVRVYDYPLRAAEVNHIYSGVPMLCAAPVGVSYGSGDPVAFMHLDIVGETNADVTLYYGTTDPGATSNGWGGSISLGTVPLGLVTAPVTGLSTGMYFRFYATNTVLSAEAWSVARVIPAGMVGYWKFDEGSGGIAYDRSAFMNDGYVFGAPTWVQGHTGGADDWALSYSNNAASFVKVTDAASLHIGGSPNNTFTIGAWVYDKISGYGEAFCYGTAGIRNLFWQTENGGVGASYFWSDSNGAVRFAWAGLGTANLWHHIAIQCDGTSFNFYRDGVLQNSNGASALSAWGDLFFGKSSTSIQPWNGMIDDVVIFDSVEDIAQIMSGSHPSMTSTPPPRVGGDGAWIRASTGGLWGDTNNWSGGVIAGGQGSTAHFDGLDITTDNTVSLDFPLTIGSLVFGDTDGTSGASWTLDNNGDPANTLMLRGGASITVNPLGAGGAVTISAGISGVDGLVKSGAGTLVLAGANLFIGETYINGGTLSAGALPNAGAVAFNNGGMLVYTGAAGNNRLDTASGSDFVIDVTSGNLTVSRTAGNYNTIVKGGNGTLTIANGYWDDGGDLTVNQGVVVLAGAVNIGALYDNVGSVRNVLPGATVKLGNSNGGQVFGYAGRVFTMTGGTFDVNGQNPANNQNGSVPAIDGNGTILNNAANPGTAVFTISTNKTFSGNIVDGAGKLSVALVAGGGTWTLTGTNTYSGTTIVSGGTLQAGSTTAFSSNSMYNVGAGRLLDLNGLSSTIGSLTGAGMVSVTNATLTVGADNGSPAAFTGVIAGPGSIVKVGSGVQVLSGTNTYSGDTIIMSGTLSSTTEACFPDGADVHLVRGATLDLNFTGTDTVRSLYVDDNLMPAGKWGAPGNHEAHQLTVFSGSGTLTVVIGSPDGGVFLLR